MAFIKIPLFFLIALSGLGFAAENKGAPSKETAKKEVAAAENAPTPFSAFTGKVKGKLVRLRLRPDLESPVLRELNRDDLLIVDGEKNNFYAVRPPKDIKGYVFRSYVLEDVVEGSRVNVRLKPSVDSIVLGQLNAGDKVKGHLSDKDNKWLEIELPESFHLFVAKELIVPMGKPELLMTLEQRRHEAFSLLNNSCLLSQAELRKPYEEIDIERISQNFQKIISEYGDFTEQATKAKELLTLTQEAYAQKKIAFLEAKHHQAKEGLVAKQAALDAEIQRYQKRLTEIDQKLHSEASFPTHAIATAAKATFVAKENNAEGSFHMATDKMLAWEPIEELYFQTWASEKEMPVAFDDFYQGEELEAVTLSGIIEPFDRIVKNRPGDFVLKNGDSPIAYLYSTKINLQEKVGQQVKVMGVQRPNNNFAFPAYFVLSVD